MNTLGLQFPTIMVEFFFDFDQIDWNRLKSGPDQGAEMETY